jgi:uncharacterized membrane protein
MNDALLVIAVASVTVGSRVGATVLLPVLHGRAAAAIERLPAPLFAAMAAVSLHADAEARPDRAVLLAVAAALVVSRQRSLLITVLAGIAGFVVGNLG